MPDADVEAWLSRASPGYCNITVANLESSCAFGDRGVLGLSQAAASSGWKLAAAECLAKCSACPRCAHVSMSVQYIDCSWYAECDEESLNDRSVPTPAFRSAAVAFTSRPMGSSSSLKLQAVARSLDGLHCLSPAGLPIGEPHSSTALADLERAMLEGRVRRLPHHVLRLQTINPDNVGETLGTLLSALAVQADAPTIGWQLAWNPRQHAPTPKHASSLLRHMAKHVWRDGAPVAASEMDGRTVGCYAAVRAVSTYDFASRVAASAKAVEQLRALLRQTSRPRAVPTVPAAGPSSAPNTAPAPTAVLFQRPVGRADNGRAIINEEGEDILRPPPFHRATRRSRADPLPSPPTMTVGALGALRAAGFAARAVSPSALSLAALAHALSTTTLLVGVHGAAFAHCMWQPPGRSALIEAFLPDHAYGLYPLFARVRAGGPAESLLLTNAPSLRKFRTARLSPPLSVPLCRRRRLHRGR